MSICRYVDIGIRIANFLSIPTPLSEMVEEKHFDSAGIFMYSLHTSVLMFYPNLLDHVTRSLTDNEPIGLAILHSV